MSNVVPENPDDNESEIDLDYGTEDLGNGQVLTNDDKYRLEVLKVRLEHEVLPQHEIETRAGSHVPSPEQRALFEQYVPIKRGYYSSEEDNIIIQNWQKFCKIHNWNEDKYEPFIHFKSQRKTYFRSKIERRKFVQFLANGLPNRTLYSVYHRFKNLLTNHKQKRYTIDEDTRIIDHLEGNPHVNEKTKFADLAKMLNRTRASVWRRYQILKKEKKPRRKKQ